MRNKFVLEDILLNQMRRERSIAKILTANGTCFQGKIRGFDNETIILDFFDGSQSLFYKKNILSVTSEIPILTELSENSEIT